MSNELQFRREEIKVMPNRVGTMGQYMDDPAPDYKPEQFQEVPELANRLHIQNLLVDPDTYNKAQAIEAFIQDSIKREQHREGAIGYNTVLQRMLDRLPESFEFMMRNNQGLQVLDFLFREVSITNKMSSQTYLKKVGEDIKQRKITSLIQQLERELAIL